MTVGVGGGEKSHRHQSSGFDIMVGGSCHQELGTWWNSCRTCWRNAKYNVSPGLTEVISSPDKPEVVHSVSRVQGLVCACAIMPVYAYVH